VNVHYENLGFNGSEIGFINSTSLIFAMIITPLWGVWADKSQKYKTILALVMILASLSGFVWSFQTTLIGVVMLATCITVFRSAINPLADSLSVSYCANQSYDFGKIRGIGSLSYVMGSFVLANIANHFGIQGPYMLMMCATLLIAAGISHFFPNMQTSNTLKIDTKKLSIWESAKILSKNKRYVFIVILMLFTNLTMDSAGGYIGNHLINALEAEQSAIALYTLIAALPEVFFIMIVGNIVSRYGFKSMYLLAIISQIIRLIGYSLVDSVPLFMFFTLPHMIMTGAGAVVNMNYIQKSVDPKILTTAVSLYTGIYLVGQALYTQIFGFIYQLWGSHTIFTVSAILTSIGLVMVLMTKQLNFQRR
jgi:Arabinose efflux permease